MVLTDVVLAVVVRRDEPGQTLFGCPLAAAGAGLVTAGRNAVLDVGARSVAAQQAGEAITARSGLPDKAKYPVY